MRFHILAVDSKRPVWSRKAFGYYHHRFDRSVQVEWSGIQPEKNYKSLIKKTIINKESLKLINSVKDGEIIVSLDKHESNWNSFRFEEKFDQWISSSTNV
jgi:23S rRNA pseudoU1915 N3-methylase RlmH